MLQRGCSWWLAGAFLLACGGSNSNTSAQPPAAGDEAAAPPSSAAVAPPPAASPAPAVASAAPAASSSSAGSTAGSGDAGAKRPFAANPQEATEYIDAAVETRRDDVERCVSAARERRKTPHAEISVELGIDQQGMLVGVKAPRGQPNDKVFLECVRSALFGAPFPSSKAGVITLKKTFSDQVINKR